MADWRNIDTAPRDGTLILALLNYNDGPEEYAVIKWDGSNLRFPWADRSGASCVAEQIPTHWVPVPSPMKAMG